jgi:UDP-3-O-[3-hydroxymyristoyl] glucosamine N-acyltransferase
MPNGNYTVEIDLEDDNKTGNTEFISGEEIDLEDNNTTDNTEFISGEEIYVSKTDPDCNNHNYKRIFITKSPFNDGYICVEEPHNKRAKQGELYYPTYTWKYAKKIMKEDWKPIDINMNKNQKFTPDGRVYPHAIINEDNVIFGDYKFGFDAVKKLYNAVQEAKKFNEDNE